MQSDTPSNQKRDNFVTPPPSPYIYNHRDWLFVVGDSKLIHLSIGTQNVWGVDSDGMVHLRIGIKGPSKNYLNPAWVPVDGSTHAPGAKFVKVVTGPTDWMVSAYEPV